MEESRCLQLQRRSAWCPHPNRSGVQAVDGEQPGAQEGQGGPGGGLGPILLAPSLSSFVWGTNYSNRAVWRFRWEFGSLRGRWKMNFTGASTKRPLFNWN